MFPGDLKRNLSNTEVVVNQPVANFEAPPKKSFFSTIASIFSSKAKQTVVNDHHLIEQGMQHLDLLRDQDLEHYLESPLFKDIHSASLIDKTNPALREYGSSVLDLFQDEAIGQKLDDERFAHIHAESIGEGTSLEGATALESEQFFHAYLGITHIAAIREDTELKQTLAEAEDVAKRLGAIKNLLKSDPVSGHLQLKGYASELWDRISKLEDGKALAFEAGTHSHAIFFEFERYTDAGGQPKIRLYVYDTGAGGIYSPGQTIKGKIKRTPMICLEDIPLQPKERQVETLTTLLEIGQFLGSKVDLDIGYLHTKVLPGFGGEFVDVPISEQEIITMQRAGFCSEKVLHAYLRRYLIRKQGVTQGTKIYKAFMEEYKFVTLALFFNNNRNGLTRQQRILIKHAIKSSFTRLNKKLERGDKLTKAEYTQAAVIAAIRHELKLASPQPHWETRAPVDWQSIDKKAVPLKARVRVPFTYNPFEASNTAQKIEPSKLEVPYSWMQIPPMQSADEVLKTGAELAEFLEKGLASSANEYELRVYLTLFHHYIAQLPIPHHDESYLSLSVEQNREFIKTLDRLTAFAAKIEPRLYDTHRTNQNPHYHKKVLAIMHKLVCEDEDNGVDAGPKSNYKRILSSNYKKNVQNKRIQNEGVELNDYFRKVKTPALLKPFPFKNALKAEYSAQFKNFESYYSQFLNTDAKDYDVKLAEAMFDFEGKVLPASVALLRKNVMRSRLLKRHAVREPIESVACELEKVNDKLTLALKVNNKEINEAPKTDFIWNEHLFPNLKEEGIIGSIPEMLQDPRFRYYSYYSDLANKRPITNLTYQQSRDLRYLAHAQELSAVALAQFIEESLPLLSDTSYQGYLEALLYRPNALDVDFLTNAQNSEALLKHFPKWYKQLESHGNLSAALFILKLADMCWSRVNSRSIEVEAPFISRQHELEVLWNKPLNLQDKALVAAHLLDNAIDEMALDGFSDADLTRLVEASIVKASLGEQIHFSCNSESDHNELLIRLLPVWIDRLKSNPQLGNQVAQHVAEQLKITSEKLIWKHQENLWSAELPSGALIQIDLLTKLVYVNDKPISELSDEIKRHPLFKQIVQDRSYSAISLGDNVFAIYLEPSKQRIHLKYSPYTEELILQTQMEGRVWQALSKRDINTIPEFPQFDVESSSYVWVTCDGGEQMIKFREDLNGVNHLMRIQDDKATIIRKSTNYSNYVLQNFKGDVELEELLGPFLRIEDENWVQLWKAPSNEKAIYLIDLPRFNLQFEVFTQENGDRAVRCVQHPELYLDLEKEWTGFKEDIVGLTLVHRDHPEQKTLMLPLQKRKTQAFLSLGGQTQPVRKDQKNRMLQMTVTADNTLLPKTKQDHLYLFYLYLIKANDPHYLKLAQKEIAKVGKVGAYNQKELEIIGWIFAPHKPQETNPVLWKDSQIAALLLKMAAGLIKNQAENQLSWKTIEEQAGIKQSDLTKVLNAMLEAYYSGGQLSSEYRLQPQEEKALFKFLDHNNALKSSLIELAASAHTSAVLPAPQIQVVPSEVAIDYDKREIAYFYNMPSSVSNAQKELAKHSVAAPEIDKLFFHFLVLALDKNPQIKADLQHRLDLMKVPETDEDLKSLLYAALQLDPMEAAAMTKQIYSLKKADRNKQKEISDEIVETLSKIKVSYTIHKASYESEKTSTLPPFEITPIGEPSQEPVQLTVQIKEAIPGLSLVRKNNALAEECYKPLDCPQPDYTAWFDDVNVSIAQAEKDAKTVREQLVVTNPAAHRLMLEVEADRIYPILDKSKEDILAIVNKRPDTTRERLHYDFKQKMGLIKNYKDIPELIFAYEHGGEQAWKQLNPYLTAEDIQNLNQQVTSYLELYTRYQSDQRKIDIYNQLDNPKLSKEEIGALLKRLETEINAMPAYNAKDSSPQKIRLFLSMEALQNIRLRPRQIELFSDILNGVITDEGKEFIAELMMGEGKSSVIFPLLARALANGKRTIFIIIPKELVSSQREQISGTTGHIFDQYAHTFHFERNTPLTKTHLEDLKNLIDNVTKAGEYFVIDPEKIENIQTKYSELRDKSLHTTLNANEKLALKYLAQILDGIGERGVFLLDEADTILNIRRERNFSTGTPEKLPDTIIHQANALYRKFLQPPYNQWIDLSKADNIASYELHKTEIHHQLAKDFAAEFISNDDSKRQQLENYFLHPREEEPSFIQTSNMRDQIHFIRGQIQTYLPLTLPKKGYKQYAFSKQPNNLFVIPATLSQPTEGAQFGTAEETINYFLQHIAQTGPTAPQMTLALRKIKEAAAFVKSSGETNERVSMFHQLWPGEDIETISEIDAARLADAIRYNPQATIDFATAFLLEEIQIYPRKVSTTPLDLAALPAKIFGATGLLWNEHSIPARFTPKRDHSGVGGMVALLRAKALDIKDPVRFTEEPLSLDLDPEEKTAVVVNNILDTFKDIANLCAIIDTGAVLIGLPPKSIVEALFTYFDEHGLPFEGVRLYIDNEPFVFEKGRGLVEEGQSQLPKELIFTVYDNAHCIGADFKLSLTGVGVQTLSEDLLQKDKFQGAKRERDLEGKQNLVYFGYNRCQTFVSKQLYNGEKQKIDLEDMQKFVTLTQAKLQSEDVTRYAFGNITAEIKQQVLKTTIQYEASEEAEIAEEIARVFNFEGIFSVDQRFDPIKNTAGAHSPKPPMSEQEALIELWKGRMATVLQNYPEGPIHDLALTIKEKLDKHLLPPKERQRSTIMQQNTNIGTEVHQEVAVSTEKQEQKQAELNVEKQHAKDVAGSLEFYVIHANVPSEAIFNAEKKDRRAGYFSIKEAFSVCGLTDFAEFLPDNLYISTNLINKSRNYHLFGEMQKAIHHFCVEPNEGGHSYYLIEENDFHQLTRNDNIQTSYWVHTPSIDHTTGGTSVKEQTTAWRTTDEAIGIRALTLLLDGRLSYPKEELNYLENLCVKMGPHQFENLVGRILQNKDQRKRYPNSALCKMIRRR